MTAERKDLQGKLVTLHPLVVSDCTEEYIGWLNDPEVNRYLETRWVNQGRNTIKAFLEKMEQSNDSVLFGINRLKDGKHVGNIKIGPVERYHLYADISYFIGDRSAWGQGLATEALSLVTRFGFDEMGLYKCKAGVYSSNKGSIRVLEKVGYQLEGRLRDEFLGEDGREDKLVYGMKKRGNKGENKRVNKPITSRRIIQSDIEKINACPWCQSIDKSQWGDDAGLFNTVSCLSCGLVYVNRRLNSRGLKKYYENYYSQEHSAVPEAGIRDAMYKLEFDFINQHIKKGRVLDVGCGGGDFLEYFKNDFECWGIEIDGEGVKNARRRISKNILFGTLTETTIEKEFDLIIFRGTIEHIPNAKETLIKAMGLLNPSKESMIYITSTPNIECISAKIFKTNWTQHLPEEHIYHFGKKHFDNLFEEYGLTCLQEKYFYEETPYANVEEDIKLVAKGIILKQKGEPINFKSPPFYENMMSLIYSNKRI